MSDRDERERIEAWLRHTPHGPAVSKTKLARDAVPLVRIPEGITPELELLTGWRERVDHHKAAMQTADPRFVSQEVREITTIADLAVDALMTLDHRMQALLDAGDDDE